MAFHSIRSARKQSIAIISRRIWLNITIKAENFQALFRGTSLLLKENIMSNIFIVFPRGLRGWVPFYHYLGHRLKFRWLQWHQEQCEGRLFSDKSHLPLPIALPSFLHSNFHPCQQLKWTSICTPTRKEINWSLIFWYTLLPGVTPERVYI